MDPTIRSFQKWIIREAAAKLGRDLSGEERRFVESRGSFLALEAAADTVRRRTRRSSSAISTRRRGRAEPGAGGAGEPGRTGGTGMLTKRELVVAAVALAAGGAAGTAAGGGTGFKTGMAVVLNQALVKDARDVTTRIELLGHIRAGRKAEAVELVETGMDDLLIGFDPDTEYPGLDARTRGEMDKAIGAAKEYRKTHPWPEGPKGFRGAMVKSLFERR